MMSSHGSARFTEPETMEGLIADRRRMWHGFTNATIGVVVFLALLLIGMAVFLL
jgi:hypothetical protein